jgi:hypothetical protein
MLFVELALLPVSKKKGRFGGSSVVLFLNVLQLFKLKINVTITKKYFIIIP